MGYLSWLLALFCIYTCLGNPFNTISAKDIMTPSQRLKDGQTLVSPSGKFELGFFSTSQQKDARYLGIWYKGILPQTIVWVANTARTLQFKNARLQLESNGALVLYDHTGIPIYISTPSKNASNPYLQICDTGNLVVKDDKVNLIPWLSLWQSFDYPSDTLLPTMDLGWRSGRTLALTSWKDFDDPSPGEFTFGLDNPQLPQLLLKRNSNKISRWGPWEGVRFSGSDAFDTSTLIHPFFKDGSFIFYGTDGYLIRLQVTPVGKIQFLLWNSSISKWNLVATMNKDLCDDYNTCGPYGICHPDKRNCRCLKGFVPNKARNQLGVLGTGGCKREIERKCDVAEGFSIFRGLKLPDNGVVWPNLTANQCKKSCLQECKCNAYTHVDVFGSGPSCLVWLDELLDMRAIPERGDDIHIRMARSTQTPPPTPGPVIRVADQIPSTKMVRKKNLTVIIIVSSLCVLVFFVLLIICWFKKQSARRLENKPSLQRSKSITESENSDFRLFKFDVLSIATSNFSKANKIGEGGFGPVYKGVLDNGREIAVKRLSSSSRQGQEQFENESSVIARLQHRNLVKLVGCCVHKVERMLIYEYLPNKSLDKFIFDQARKMLINWATRFDIILGVAKGLAYLHDDSGLRIVHRDLKASNILLDGEMTPKISDFGLAKILEDGIELNDRTNNVYGTFGYISPEYAMNGQCSTKSDVFSFGVLVLEIISGKKNWGFHHPEHDMNLLGHAWNLWSQGRALELIDPDLGYLSLETQIRRCIQVGLLCAQHDPDQRPTMCTIVTMLSHEDIALPEPTMPGFIGESSYLRTTADPMRPSPETSNGLTVTTLYAR